MAASMRPRDYWVLTHRRFISLTKSLLLRRAKDAGLESLARDRGSLRPLPQRIPIGIDQLGGGLAVVDDVAELLQIDRIEVVRADIEDAVVDHPELGVIADRLAAGPAGVGPKTQWRQVDVAAQQRVDRIGSFPDLIARLGIARVDPLLHHVAQMAGKRRHADLVGVAAA